MIKETHFECGDLERFSDYIMANRVDDQTGKARVESYCGIKVIEKAGVPKDMVYLVTAEGKYTQSFKI